MECDSSLSSRSSRKGRSRAEVDPFVSRQLSLREFRQQQTPPLVFYESDNDVEENEPSGSLEEVEEGADNAEESNDGRERALADFDAEFLSDRSHPSPLSKAAKHKHREGRRGKRTIVIQGEK